MRAAVRKIQQWINSGLEPSEIAVLYRSNAQSRVLEHAFFTSGMPYRVYGGMRFFERAEVKHALAYLRLVANPEDDGALPLAVTRVAPDDGPRPGGGADRGGGTPAAGSTEVSRTAASARRAAGPAPAAIEPPVPGSTKTPPAAEPSAAPITHPGHATTKPPPAGSPRSVASPVDEEECVHQMPLSWCAHCKPLAR